MGRRKLGRLVSKFFIVDFLTDLVKTGLVNCLQAQKSASASRQAAWPTPLPCRGSLAVIQKEKSS
jgi:hypothetical protein